MRVSVKKIIRYMEVVGRYYIYRIIFEKGNAYFYPSPRPVLSIQPHICVEP